MSDRSCSSLMRLGFCILAFNSIIVIINSSDGGTLRTALLLAENFFLLILLSYVSRFGQEAPLSASVKVAVWFLTVSLAAMFSWSVSTSLSFFGAKIVWLIAGATSLGGFYAFFLQRRSLFSFSLAFLTFNSWMVTYGLRTETGLTAETAFAVFHWVAYLDILAFVCSLSLLMGMSSTSPHQGRIKFAVWFLGTLLAVMACSKATEVYPKPVAGVAWAIFAASSFKVFHAYFVQHEPVLPI